MYRGFVGTFISHFLSLLCTLWAIFEVHSCMFDPLLLNCARVGLLLVAANSSLGLVRYERNQGGQFWLVPRRYLKGYRCRCDTYGIVLGSSDGYKLRTWHIVTLNVSAITNFSITEAVVLHMRNAPFALLSFPALNVIPLFSNILAKEYRTKLRFSDVFIGINCLILLLSSFLNENYYGMALSLSNFFGYFIIGDSGYFLDTEVPSIDAFQYLTCFLNFFNGCSKYRAEYRVTDPGSHGMKCKRKKKNYRMEKHSNNTKHKRLERISGRFDRPRSNRAISPSLDPANAARPNSVRQMFSLLLTPPGWEPLLKK